jgi:hypothetical protein
MACYAILRPAACGLQEVARRASISQRSASLLMGCYRNFLNPPPSPRDSLSRLHASSDHRLPAFRYLNVLGHNRLFFRWLEFFCRVRKASRYGCIMGAVAFESRAPSTIGSLPSPIRGTSIMAA